MKLRIIFGLLLTSSALWAAGPADPLAEAAAKATQDYAVRLGTATRELAAVRSKINAERLPMAEATRAAELRLATLEGEILRLETAHARAADTRQQLQREADGERRNLNYLITQAQESLKTVTESLRPGEQQLIGERIDELRRQLETATPQSGAAIALTVADFATDRLARELGGHVAAGKAVDAGTNLIVPGSFAFVGPEVFFLPDQGGAPGTVRTREGREWPTVYAVPKWTAADAGEFFRRGQGVVALDATGGKALTLLATEGSLFDNIRKGGTVGYVIIAIGFLALAISVQKLLDFRKLAVDEPPTVRPALGALAKGDAGEAETVVRGFKTTTRELFTLGLRHRLKPKAILEEHLESFVLQQRMLQERRLPLLAVIATSGPLLGLLGTVSGMIKTFTLITVFGTGSAGKLSAGISEALVATKLGLTVAIPALVIHGFLSQRIQKHLAMLERYALELVTASEESRRGDQKPIEPAKPAKVVTAEAR